MIFLLSCESWLGASNSFYFTVWLKERCSSSFGWFNCTSLVAFSCSKKPGDWLHDCQWAENEIPDCGKNTSWQAVDPPALTNKLYSCIYIYFRKVLTQKTLHIRMSVEVYVSHCLVNSSKNSSSEPKGLFFSGWRERRHKEVWHRVDPQLVQYQSQKPVLIAAGHVGETARSSGLWRGSSGDAAVCGSVLFVCCQAGPSGGQQKHCSWWRR